jgi:hypothetical protein
VALCGVQASLLRDGGDRWSVSFRFLGRINALRVPPPAVAQRNDELWRHLCGELFLMVPDGHYAEFNFAPSGCWAAYVFDGYRRGMRPAQLRRDPVVTSRRDDDALELDALLILPAAMTGVVPLRIALCAMVEEADGTLSCWAQHHADGQPDFHRADGFREWR